MLGRRLLKFINAAIGVALAAILGAAYWYGWRPVAKTSGEFGAPVTGPVKVERDTLGMPRIHAGTLEDLFFAQGFVTAQDRFWQMETFRRLTAGELSEIVGRAALDSDREFRRFRMSRLAEQKARSLAGEDRQVIVAYVRGVNHYLETHRDRLPLEFSLLGYKPRPWSVEDTMLVALMMYHSLSTTYKHDLAREAMEEKGDPEKLRQLWLDRSGQEEQPGSNVWAVGGSFTRSGKAALANDMHVAWSFPGTWYMVHLKGAGLNVAGVSIPGAPGVVVGRNDQIAWGITNLGFDVQDVYFENSNPSGTAIERDRIPIRDAPGEVFQQPVRTNSPIIAGPGGRPVSLRWVAAEDRPFHLGLLKINRAHNWEQFREALREFPGAGSNVAYADRQGNIGLQVSAVLPIRRGCDGHRVNPVGTCQWEGYIPYEDLPSFYNPASGRVISGNQNPFLVNYPYTVSGNFAPHFRSNQIRERLEAGKKRWTPEEMVRLQADVYSAFSHFIARELVSAWDRKKAADPALKDAVDLLRAWDGLMLSSAPQPLIATYTTNHLRRSLALKASNLATAEWEPFMYFAAIERLLRKKPAGWYEDWDHELLRCLGEGLEEGARRQGSDVRKWSWGEFNRLAVVNPVTSRIPWIGGYFQVRPAGLDGSPTTVRQITARVGPSMRMVVDFGDPQGGLLNIPFGQSGHSMSGHLKDQWSNHLHGISYPLHFDGGWTVEATLTLRPQ